MNVLYYYCYLLYTKVIPEDEPYATTVFVLSFLESFFVFSVCNVIVAYLNCITLDKWIGISLMAIFLVINYLAFNRSGLSRKIVEERPTFFNSHQISIVIFGFLFFLSVSSLFWAPIWTKQILDQCH